MKKASDIGQNILKQLNKNGLVVLQILIDSWDKIVGEEIAAFAQVEKIFSNTLVITCLPEKITEIHYAQEFILKSVNAFLGIEKFSKLKIIVENYVSKS